MVSDVTVQDPIGKSDHSVISFTFCGFANDQGVKFKLDYNKADYARMGEMLTLDWEMEMKDKSAEEQGELILTKICSAIDKCIPLRKCTGNASQNTLYEQEN